MEAVFGDLVDSNPEMVVEFSLLLICGLVRIKHVSMEYILWPFVRPNSSSI